MRVFAHRGLPEGGEGCGSNTPFDFIRAFQSGYDVEMDLRRWHGRIYVSHDPIMTLEGQQSLHQFLDLLVQFPTRMALIGLKEDSLGKEVHDLAATLGLLGRIIVFDNSVPDLVWNNKHVPDLKQMPRTSEYEKLAWRGGPILLDHFKRETSEAFYERVIRYVTAVHKKRGQGYVTLISPEIHQDVSLWNMALMRADIRRAGLWGVITDRPRDWALPVEKEEPDAS